MKIRWGLLGAGEIVNRWMKGVRNVEDMEIVAVSSRTVETARKIANEWNIPRVMTYEEMIHSDEIDIVYIPVPHTSHKELAIRAMTAGKNVLVEKPAAINAVEFKEMIDCARSNSVFFMEAVWTRFFPIINTAMDIIGQGKLGDIRMVESSFSFRIDDDNNSRLVDPNRAGGGLLDVGVYNLHFMQMIFQKAPVRITGLASIDTDSCHIMVDEQEAYIGQYDKGELAVMTSGIRTQTLDTARIYGTKGYMVMPTFWKPTKLEIVIGDKVETIESAVPQRVDGLMDEGFQFELEHVNQCLRDGLKESPLVPLETSLSVLQQCDKLREQWGIKYPCE